MKRCVRFFTIAFFVFASTGTVLANGQESYDGYYAKLEQMQECVDQATNRDAMRACVGITYDDCLSETKGSRVDESYCLNADLGFLVSIYRREVIKHFVEIQRWSEDPSSGVVMRREFFNRALQTEIEWNEYREAQCVLDMSWYGTGNAVATAGPICNSTFYADRIYRLKRGFSGR